MWNDRLRVCELTHAGAVRVCKEHRGEWAFTCEPIQTCAAGSGANSRVPSPSKDYQETGIIRSLGGYNTTMLNWNYTMSYDDCRKRNGTYDWDIRRCIAPGKLTYRECRNAGFEMAYSAYGGYSGICLASPRDCDLLPTTHVYNWNSLKCEKIDAQWCQKHNRTWDWVQNNHRGLCLPEGATYKDTWGHKRHECEYRTTRDRGTFDYFTGICTLHSELCTKRGGVWENSTEWDWDCVEIDALCNRRPDSQWDDAIKKCIGTHEQLTSAKRKACYESGGVYNMVGVYNETKRACEYHHDSGRGGYNTTMLNWNYTMSYDDCRKRNGTYDWDIRRCIAPGKLTYRECRNAGFEMAYSAYGGYSGICLASPRDCDLLPTTHVYNWNSLKCEKIDAQWCQKHNRTWDWVQNNHRGLCLPEGATYKDTWGHKRHECEYRTTRDRGTFDYFTGICTLHSELCTKRGGVWENSTEWDWDCVEIDALCNRRPDSQWDDAIKKCIGTHEQLTSAKRKACYESGGVYNEATHTCFNRRRMSERMHQVQQHRNRVYRPMHAWRNDHRSFDNRFQRDRKPARFP